MAKWCTTTKRRDYFWSAALVDLETVDARGSSEALCRVGAAKPGAKYEVTWSELDNLKNEETVVVGSVRLDEQSARLPEAAWGPEDDAGYRYAIADIRSLHPDFPNWSKPVRVGRIPPEAPVTPRDPWARDDMHEMLTPPTGT